MNRLNVGCGGYPHPDFTNLDMIAGPGIDIVSDFFEWATFEATASEPRWDVIRADHWLEHVGRDDAHLAMQFFHALLKDGGLLWLEVPDMAQILAGNTGGFEIMQCVYGAQPHPGEYHKWGYTASSLTYLAVEHGFKEISVTCFISDHPMRSGFPSILMTCRK